MVAILFAVGREYSAKKAGTGTGPEDRSTSPSWFRPLLLEGATYQRDCLAWWHCTLELNL